MEKQKDIIAWWSGGVTSAVTCMICIETYGRSRVRVIFIDTHNEHEDTYRFKKDCEDWYKLPIETISNIGEEYKTIQDVWIKHKSLNVAHGAICSYKLKRIVIKYLKDFSIIVKGFIQLFKKICLFSFQRNTKAFTFLRF